MCYAAIDPQIRPNATRSAVLLVALWLSVCAPMSGRAAEQRQGPEFRSTVDAATVLYDAPSSKSQPLFVVGPAYPVEVMVALQGWTKIRDSGGSIAWVESRLLSPKRTVIVRSRMAVVRAAPEEPAATAYRVGQGVLLEWIETLPSGWTRVRHVDSGVGFVRSADLWGV